MMAAPPEKPSLPTITSSPQDLHTQQLHENYWDQDASGPSSTAITVNSDQETKHDDVENTDAEAVAPESQAKDSGRVANGVSSVLKNAKASATTIVSSVSSLFPKLPSVGWPKFSGERESNEDIDRRRRTHGAESILSLENVAPVTRLKATVQDILTGYNQSLTRQGAPGPDAKDATVHPNTPTQNFLLDDSINDNIGIIIRKTLCGDLANLLRHRMYPSRAGGLFSNSLWTLVQCATPKPSPQSYSAFDIKAYRVMRDLSTNECMDNDDDRKFRSFICAGLNHHFLCAWLLRLHNNTAVKYKFYEPDAFMVACPEHVFKELLVVLDPLMALPFRLFTSFERRRRTMSADKSRRTPRRSSDRNPDVPSANTTEPQAGPETTAAGQH
eukprot:m.351397 g.351397  ORF g.351397 m.351397 type:complete len:386 (+) comp20699_c0_seq4:281-1438(+)